MLLFSSVVVSPAPPTFRLPLITKSLKLTTSSPPPSETFVDDAVDDRRRSCAVDHVTVGVSCQAAIRRLSATS
jgi:hypothetical protein